MYSPISSGSARFSLNSTHSVSPGSFARSCTSDDSSNAVTLVSGRMLYTMDGTNVDGVRQNATPLVPSHSLASRVRRGSRGPRGMRGGAWLAIFRG
jgi:hypothetical protein